MAEVSFGTYDPVRPGDPESLLRQQAKDFEIALSPVLDQQESDLKRKTELDMNKYQDLIEFLPKVKRRLEARALENIKDDRALALKKLSEHNAKYPEQSQKLIDQQDELEEIVLDTEVQTQKLAKKLEEQNSSFFVTEEFKNLSPYGQNAAIKGYADKQFILYKNNFPKLDDYESIAGYQGAVSKYELEYLSKFSDLEDMNYKPSFLEKYVFQPVRDLNDTKRAEWEVGVKQKAKDIDIAQRNEDYRNSLRNTEVSKKEGLAKLIQTQVLSILHHHNGDKSAAHAEVVAQTLKAIDAGGVETSLIKTLQDPKLGLIEHSSSDEKQLYSKIFKDEYNLLRKAALKKDTDDLNELKQEKDGKALNIIEDTHAAIAAKQFFIPTGELETDGTPKMMPTDQLTYLTYQNKEYEALTGHTSHIINDMLKVVDPSIVKDKYAIQQLTKLDKLGLLTNDMLTSDKVSPDVAELFRTKANTHELNNRQFVGSDVFTTKAKSYFKSSANLDPSVEMFGSKAHARYQKILRAKLATNPTVDFDRVNQWALEDTLKWMDEEVKNKGLKSGRTGFNLNKLNKVNLDIDLGSKEENAAYKLINDAVHSLGFDALTEPDENGDSYFATKEELKLWSKGWGTGAWKPNGSLLYLAELYGTSPSQILNTLRETAGLEKVKSPHSILQIESIQDLSNRRALLINPLDSDIRGRATHTIIDPDPTQDGDEYIKELIPNANVYEQAINEYEIYSGDKFDLGEKSDPQYFLENTTGDLNKLLPYIAFSDQLEKQGFKREDMLKPGTEAFKELQKSFISCLKDRDLKQHIINTYLLKEGLVTKGSSEYQRIANDTNYLKAIGKSNDIPNININK